MEDQCMVGAFIHVIHDDVMGMRRKLQLKEAELEEYLNKLSPENRAIADQFIREREERST